ncbi:related to ethanolamine kinase [Phialocephala subalpina]|uniref:ethanolamine kinase n=1 Tax=Phialocephala subalpina TaxID=576137 RepID=A0A1L7X4W4_9HELO|nr:related to ethanolamine kinase [Phialocephala subalpina]
MEVPYFNKMFDESAPNVSVGRMASMLFTNWNLGHGSLDVVLLTDASSKALYRVEHRRYIAFDQTKHPEAVLIKVYRGTDRTVDRSKALKFHRLLSTSSSSSLAPPPILRFPNGHAYPFIHGQVCYSLSSLTPKMVWKAIAKEMARWHTCLPVVDLEFVVERGKGFEGLPDVGPNIWTRAREWIEEHGEERKVGLEVEFEYLLERLGARSLTTEQLVLGHGDLVPRNIILQGRNKRHSAEEKIKAVKFIDYEHCIYCPPAFELANHFSSWVGYECNYDQLPTKTIRKAFIEEYVSACRKYSSRKGEENEENESKEAAVSKLMDEVDRWRGFPGFYWGLCALIQATDAESDPGMSRRYAEYSKLRFAEYYSWKEEEDGSRDKESTEMSLRERRWATEDDILDQAEAGKLENLELQCPNHDNPN